MPQTPISAGVGLCSESVVTQAEADELMKPPGWVPSPDEIREACLEIQAGWSARERERRMAPAYRRQAWQPQGSHGRELD